MTLGTLTAALFWTIGSGIGWKSKLELWPYVAIAISVIGLLYMILTFDPLKKDVTQIMSIA
jgi:hypothetical protein